MGHEMVVRRACVCEREREGDDGVLRAGDCEGRGGEGRGLRNSLRILKVRLESVGRVFARWCACSLELGWGLRMERQRS